MDKLNIKFLVYLGFLTSGVITFNAYNKDGLEWKTSVLIWLSTVLILESGKGISFFAFTRTKKTSWMLLWLSLMLVSIVGNMCFLVRDAVENANSKIVFEDVKGKKASLEEQIAYKKADKINVASEKQQALSSITNEKSQQQNQVKEYNSTINSLQSQINTKNKELATAIKKKYAKTPDVIKKQINTLTDTLNKTISARDKLGQVDSSIVTTQASKIDKIDEEINALQSQANEISVSDASPTKKVAGITTLFEYLGIGYEFAEFATYLFIAVIFEILICALYLHLQGVSLRGRSNSTPLGSKNPNEFIPENNPIPKQEITQPKTENNPIPKRIIHYKKSPNKPKITNEVTQAQTTQDNTLQYGTSDSIPTNTKPIHIEPKKIIGFQKEIASPKIEITDKNVIAFIDKMFETATNNKCIGYRKLSRLAGIKEGLGRQIFESLKQNGAIKVIGGVTTILKAKDEIKL